MSICTNLDDRREWRLNGQLHREEGPAIEWESGRKAWYLHGERHRHDGPAVVTAFGDTCWYARDEYHREGGPAVEWTNGSELWYFRGKLHRQDGPAIIFQGVQKRWFIHGIRLEGSALLHHQQSFLSHIVIAALLALDLPPYEMLFILQFAYPFVNEMDERKVVRFLQGARASSQLILK